MQNDQRVVGDNDATGKQQQQQQQTLTEGDSSNNSNDDDTGIDDDATTTNSSQQQQQQRRTTTDAGIARGAARSVVARSSSSSSMAAIKAVRLPTVGRLPLGKPPPSTVVFRAPPPTSVSSATVSSATKTAATKLRSPMPRQLPVKQVAKVSDRVSQGMDLYDIATESSSSPTITQQQQESKWARKLGSFSLNLVKNTVLGMAVFETYGTVIEVMTPQIWSTVLEDATSTSNNATTTTAINTTTTTTTTISSDVYATAPVWMHIMAGALGGCAHGIAGVAWEAASVRITHLLSSMSPMKKGTAVATTAVSPLPTPYPAVWTSATLRMISHHTMAHAALFGSYEAIKRIFIPLFVFDRQRYKYSTSVQADVVEADSSQVVNDGVVGQQRPDPLTSVEYLTGIAVAGGLAGQVQHIVSHFSEQRLLTLNTSANHSTTFVVPIRPLLLAFLPSSIAFVALEYGRRM